MFISRIIERLCSCGYQAYLVGGCVRDDFLGIPSKDEDIVTNATPEELECLFRDHDVKTVGKSFGVVLINGIEVATYRHDRYSGLNDKKCEVTFVDSLIEDLSRRDLTINSLSFCSYTGEVIDPFNGREDLKNRIIRFTGSPKDRIYEDPNRIIRACRFLAKINGKFECETFEALCKYSHYVRDYVAKERIRLEIFKALELSEPSKFFLALYEIGALDYIFPSMIPCTAHHHGKHHREDIFTHLMLCGDSISPKYPLLRLAGYLHDIGKPESYSDDGKFIGHENIGYEIVMRELQDLKFSTDEISKVSNLVKCHMFHFANSSPKVLRRLLHRLNVLDVDYREFLRLRVADRTANLAKPNLTLSDLRDIVGRFHSIINEKPPFDIKSLAINGDDVMRELDLHPGPEVGRILRELLEYTLEDGPEFNTKENLIEVLKSIN